ncbi:very short patch repair endonuclease [Methylobacterium bullatum]|uniref:very short patch repair endonuclease n=1 Tax=Methylobacterium bullatum TaxID=570505 RepID=UPI0030D48889
MDQVDAEKRSAIMRSVHSKNTKPEVALRSALHAKGYRFRLHAKDLPGRPDVVFRKRKACIFVHGCFWHRHGCSKTTSPKSNAAFWNSKFEANVARDARSIELLMQSGWRVLVIWECGISRKGISDECISHVTEWLGGAETFSEYPPTTGIVRPAASSHEPME